MKIFDGVPVNPAALSPTWQGVLGVAMLLANSFIEADKIRDQRVAREQGQRPEPTTLSDVMAQSGLNIPHFHDALTAFMGGSEEAKDAATLIVNAPDPVKLLRDFARMYTPASAANGPIVTPPPAAAPARPMPGSPAPSAGSSKDSSPRPKPAAFRPEFTREGLEATERAKTAEPRPRPAAFRPEFTREGLEAAARAAATSAPATPSAAPASVPTRSLVDTLADRLTVLGQQMQAHQQELDTRIRCAEAELAALCEELENLRVSSDRPILFVVPSIDDTEALPVAASPSSDAPLELDGEETEATAQAEARAAPEGPTLSEPTPAEPVTVADSAQSVAAVTPVDDPAPPVEDAAPPLPPAISDADLARAFSMLGDFTDQAAAHYASEAERVRALERKISHMRGLVERARGPAVGHG